jgi:hypothetical protein
MSKFVRSHPFETEFDGDKIKATLRPLDYPDMLALQRQTTEANVSERILGFVEASREVAPRYVSDFEGLTDADGEVMDFGVVANEVYFTELLQRFVSKLIEISQPPSSPT